MASRKSKSKISAEDLHYLAGFVEARGTFSPNPEVSLIAFGGEEQVEHLPGIAQAGEIRDFQTSVQKKTMYGWFLDAKERADLFYAIVPLFQSSYRKTRAKSSIPSDFRTPDWDSLDS